MKPFITILLACVSWHASAQNPKRHLDLSRKGTLLSAVPVVTDQTADKALRIASYLFSRKEFQDSISKLVYPAANYCTGYSNNGNRKDSISGNLVLDFLFRNENVPLSLVMKVEGKKPKYRKPPKNNSCFTLGVTNPGSHKITSYYENINCDMGADLPFPCAYGVHLCHEYMHDIGFCHCTDEVATDIADAVGWIAYHYIKKWYDEKDPGLLKILND